jgi:acetyl esterase/lipase
MHPAHIEDVALAYAWTQKYIGKHGGRADQMFVSGHSAGGHLVALLATDERYLKAHNLSPKNMRGVIPISGVYEIPEEFIPQVFGDEAEEASPLTHVKGNLPPFIIFFADHDLPVCGKEPSERFAKALRDKGNAAETHAVKNSNHLKIIENASSKNNDVFKMIVEFVRKNAEKK